MRKRKGLLRLGVLEGVMDSTVLRRYFNMGEVLHEIRSQELYKLRYHKDFRSYLDTDPAVPVRARQ